MRAFRILVMTDHSGHSSENSIYALLRTMVAHQGFARVWVASRGIESNRDFFEGKKGAELHIRSVGSDFAFDPEGMVYEPDSTVASAEGFDGIFLRLPPPAPREFLEFLASWAEDAIIFNKPSGILETSSKAFLMHFRQWCPPMRMCYNAQDILLFAERFPIVLKPLYNYGGKGIVRVQDDTVDLGTSTSTLDDFMDSLAPDAFPMLAMKFMEKVGNGDKRILVVNGEVQGASLRLPAEGGWLCNVAMGGYSVPAKPSERELDMAAQLSPVLLERGILIFGFDTLEDANGMRYLSEINTMSIGGMPQIEEQTGKPVLSRIIQLIWQYLDVNIKQ